MLHISAFASMSKRRAVSRRVVPRFVSSRRVARESGRMVQVEGYATGRRGTRGLKLAIQDG